MSEQIVSEEKELRLVPLDPQKDAGFLADWKRSSFPASMEGITNPCVVIDASALEGEAVQQSGDEPVEYHFAAREGGNGLLIAMVHIGRLISARHAAWLKIEMAQDGDEQAKAGAVISEALHFAFIDLGLHRVCVNIPSHDESEIAIYEEAGFLRESQRRQAVCHEGRLYDDLLYGILYSEWLKMQQEVEI